jgi:hypothetical protein
VYVGALAVEEFFRISSRDNIAALDHSLETVFATTQTDWVLLSQFGAGQGGLPAIFMKKTMQRYKAQHMATTYGATFLCTLTLKQD